MSHDERARDLLSQMTLAEKVAQLHAVWLQIEGDGTWSSRKAKSSFIKPSVDEPLEIMADGDLAGLYPFGFGLSYTEFSYDQFAVAATTVATDGSIELSFILTNSGERNGDKVASLVSST